MAALSITPLYAGVLGLILVVLSMRVIVVVRAKGKISLGDGGDSGNLEVIRGQANFIEYVPMAVILLAFAETGGTAPWAIHTMGVALVLARIVHPLGLKADGGPTVFRFVGTVTTVLVLIAASLVCLAGALL